MEEVPTLLVERPHPGSCGSGEEREADSVSRTNPSRCEESIEHISEKQEAKETEQYLAKRSLT